MNDYVGFVNEDEQISKTYSVWTQMIDRCYSSKRQEKQPTYVGCTVCEEWKYFSNFKKWFDENYIEGFQLDKDILVEGNKIYSPNTCVFVPPQINNLLLQQKTNKSLPNGVSKRKSGTFLAQIGKYGKVYNIGCFNTVEEASIAYTKAKSEYIFEVANKFYDEGLIRENLRERLFAIAYKYV